jgi:biotin transporter BioY
VLDSQGLILQETETTGWTKWRPEINRWQMFWRIISMIFLIVDIVGRLWISLRLSVIVWYDMMMIWGSNIARREHISSCNKTFWHIISMIFIIVDIVWRI